MAPAAGEPGDPPGFWRPRQAKALMALSLIGAVLVRAWVLLGSGLDGGTLVSVGAAASGTGDRASVLEWTFGLVAAWAAPLEMWPLSLGLLGLWIVYCAAALLVARSLAVQPSNRLFLLVVAVLTPLALPGMVAWPQGASQTTLAIGFLLVTAGSARYLSTGATPSLWPVPAGVGIALLGAPATPWAPVFLLIAWTAALLTLPRLTTPPSDLATDRPRLPRALAIAGVALLAIAWAAVTGGRPFGEIPRDLGRVAGYLGEAIGTGLIPGLAGGPVSWVSGFNSWPAADPPAWLTFVGIQLLLLGICLSAFRTARGLLPWGLPLTFVALALIFFTMGSVAAVTGTGDQMLGLGVAPALLLVSVASALEHADRRGVPWPESLRRFITPGRRQAMSFVAMDVVVALSILSMVTWSQARPAFVGTAYIENVRASLTGAAPDIPILPQIVPPAYVDPGYAPLNTTEVVFAPLPSRPEFLPWTSKLQTLDDTGALVPAEVKGIQVPVDCSTWAPAALISPSLPEFTYIADITLSEPSQGGFSVHLGDGPQVTVPAMPDDTRVFVQLSGSGSTIAFNPLGDAPLCIQALKIGQLDLVNPETEEATE